MAQEVQAALAGNIFKISVDVGDTVEEDDELFVVEALKMEIPRPRLFSYFPLKTPASAQTIRIWLRLFLSTCPTN